jgi:hypothetical protein
MDNTQIDYLIQGVDSPVDATFGQCPKPTTSPSPTVTTPGSDVSTVAIVVPVVLGSLFLLLVAGLVVGGLLWLYAKRHRKYYDPEGPDDPESGTEMAQVKFTFRYAPLLLIM